METFWLAMSEPPELPRSKIRSTRAAVSGRARSRATRRRKYSARDTPRSLARWRARRCISVSRVICVFAIIMAPSYCRSFPSSRVATGLEALTVPPENLEMFERMGGWVVRNNDRRPLVMFRKKDMRSLLLLVTQGHQRIDLHRPPRRQISSEKANRKQRTDNPGQGDG